MDLREAIFEIKESFKSVSIIKHYRSFIDNIKQQKKELECDYLVCPGLW